MGLGKWVWGGGGPDSCVALRYAELALLQGKSVFSAVAHTKLTVLTNQSQQQAVMARHFFKVRSAV